MAESPEHLFLKSSFLKVIEDFSSTDIYGYTEGDRKKFDMSCSLKRDWERPLVGQTLWSHEAGIDKDLRMLITEEEASIWAYVMRDTVKNRASVYEAIQDFKNSGYRDSLFKLRLFWVPPDFDADKESQRQLLHGILQEKIVDDILFHVIFGNLTRDDFQFFFEELVGIYGLSLALLAYIANHGMGNYVMLSDALGVSRGPIREKIGPLHAKRFITGTGLHLTISLKGRVFLSIVRRFMEEYRSGFLSPEMKFLLNRLGQEFILVEIENKDPTFLPRDLQTLVREYTSAERFPGFSLDESKFMVVTD